MVDFATSLDPLASGSTTELWPTQDGADSLNDALEHHNLVAGDASFAVAMMWSTGLSGASLAFLASATLQAGSREQQRILVAKSKGHSL